MQVNMTPFSLYYQNLRVTLSTTICHLNLYLLSSSFDFYVFIETWPSYNVNSGELGFNNYCSYRCDRSNVNSLISTGTSFFQQVFRTRLTSFYLKNRLHHSKL